MSAIVYAAMATLGAAFLVPWMTFLALADYFTHLYDSNVMEFSFPAVSTGSLVATSSLLLVIGPWLSFNVRIAWPTIMMCLLMLAVPLIDMAIGYGVLSRDAGFVVTLCAVCLNAVFSASAQNSTFALSSLVGGSATQAVQTGNGLIGCVSVGLRIATKVGLPSAPAMWTFCISGALILLLSLIGYAALMAEPNIKARVEAHELRRALRNRGKRSGSLEASLEAERVYEEGEGQWGSGEYAGFDEAYGIESPAPAAPGLVTALSLAGVESVCVFTVFFVCLCTFPGLTTSLQSTSWRLGSWFPIVLVSLYNLADLVGKWLPNRARLLTSQTLPYATLSHSLFVPAFVLLSKPELLPVQLRADWLPMMLVCALGLLTGYIGCMALVLGAERGRTPEEREVVGMVTSFCLMAGLCSGSLAGLLVDAWLL